MGLFKKNPADEKLKELTGGLKLKREFVSRLESEGLGVHDGVVIQRKLKREIKSGLSADEVSSRLDFMIGERKREKNIPLSLNAATKECPECGTLQDEDNTFCINCGHKWAGEKVCPMCRESQDESNAFCINCGYDFASRKSKPSKKVCPNCSIELFEKTMLCPHCRYDFRTGEIREEPKRVETPKPARQPAKESPQALEFRRRVAFLSAHEFNLKKCPDCGSEFLKTDPFCFSCGASVVTVDTERNENIKVEDGKFTVDDGGNSELSDLEALYSKTVQSRYSPAFRVAYVIYLDHYRNDKIRKFTDNMAREYETTVKKLEKQAREDAYIEPAPAISEAKTFKVSDLKEILKEHGLKVSGKKDDLIERLGENLSEDELRKHFKSKSFQISEDGIEFVDKNRFILYIFSNPDICDAVSPVDVAKIYDEKKYSDDEIYEKLLGYLKGVRDEKLTAGAWTMYRIYENAVARVLEDMGSSEDALSARFRLFLFDINHCYNGVADPKRTRLRQKDVADLVSLLHELTLPIDELKGLFEKAYGEVLFKMIISLDDALIYLLKVFGGEDLGMISADINESYSAPF